MKIQGALVSVAPLGMEKRNWKTVCISLLSQLNDAELRCALAFSVTQACVPVLRWNLAMSLQRRCGVRQYHSSFAVEIGKHQSHYKFEIWTKIEFFIHSLLADAKITKVVIRHLYEVLSVRNFSTLK